MTYFVIQKVPNNYFIKKFNSEKEVVKYLSPNINDSYLLENTIIIEGDEYELVTKLKLKLDK